MEPPRCPALPAPPPVSPGRAARDSGRLLLGSCEGRSVPDSPQPCGNARGTGCSNARSQLTAGRAVATGHSQFCASPGSAVAAGLRCPLPGLMHLWILHRPLPSGPLDPSLHASPSSELTRGLSREGRDGESPAGLRPWPREGEPRRALPQRRSGPGGGGREVAERERAPGLGTGPIGGRPWGPRRDGALRRGRDRGRAPPGSAGGPGRCRLAPVGRMEAPSGPGSVPGPGRPRAGAAGCGIAAVPGAGAEPPGGPGTRTAPSGGHGARCERGAPAWPRDGGAGAGPRRGGAGTGVRGGATRGGATERVRSSGQQSACAVWGRHRCEQGGATERGAGPAQVRGAPERLRGAGPRAFKARKPPQAPFPRQRSEVPAAAAGTSERCRGNGACGGFRALNALGPAPRRRPGAPRTCVGPAPRSVAPPCSHLCRPQTAHALCCPELRTRSVAPPRVAPPLTPVPAPPLLGPAPRTAVPRPRGGAALAPRSVSARGRRAGAGPSRRLRARPGNRRDPAPGSARPRPARARHRSRPRWRLHPPDGREAAPPGTPGRPRRRSAPVAAPPQRPLAPSRTPWPRAAVPGPPLGAVRAPAPGLLPAGTARSEPAALRRGRAWGRGCETESRPCPLPERGCLSPGGRVAGRGDGAPRPHWGQDWANPSPDSVPPPATMPGRG
ncbi:collagen alpha-1(I) chain-like [Vidua chalybeata]|uniref:collagen alpha-1(I) chain-like n=1 Tax=Vidua chalybeata TaxID=81927 RepID=UPI0023A8AF08|nr:collagen alpha-1(I) chain-like [Vidua chalybeata]